MNDHPINLDLGPADTRLDQLLAAASVPLPFVLDGGDERSWACGRGFFGCDPSAVLRSTACGRTWVERCGTRQAVEAEPLHALQDFVDGSSAPGGDLGFVAVALSYDLGRQLERGRQARSLEANRVLVHAALYDWLLVRDYRTGVDRLVARPGTDVDLRALAQRLQDYTFAAQPNGPILTTRGLVPEFDFDAHRSIVEAALDYIAAGDIYQVNLAQRFSMPQPPAAHALFHAVQHDHPVPFGAYVDAGEFQLVSNSPECFLRFGGERISTFPIKGTRRRGTGAADDVRLRQELRHDPKELAEHVMIVDLERNDLGRICVPGSVEVPGLLTVDSFPSLHHLVSEVRGRLTPGAGLADILGATFPGGSITGAPKIRAREIIDELERSERGFYTGAIGLVGPDWGTLSIAIRTATCTPAGLSYHAGGGIVADSDPRREYEELLLKAQPFAQALAAHAA